MKYTVGADPELFIINKKNNKVVSSIGIIPGIKGQPWVDPTWEKGFGLEIDNILAEFNIPPVSDKASFIKNMNFMKNYIRKFVQNINPDYDIQCIASRFVDEDQLQNDIAKLFGCSIDFNAYTEAPNPKPEGESTNLRSSGCHIHLGYPRKSVEKSLKLIKYFDMFLGIPSVVFDPDTQRRNLYGKAGCFRLTKYGLEYRVLSSKMYDTNELMDFVYNAIEKAIDAFERNVELINPDTVQECINESNVKLAKELIKRYNLI